MKISQQLEAKLNAQINAELYSGYLYLSMATWAEANGLGGTANWLRKQAAEEQTHAMKIFDFVFRRAGRVTLTAIEAPRTEWKDLEELFAQVYEHEQKVTGMIYDLVRVARAEEDFATVEMLLWFVNEQVEEEEDSLAIYEKVKVAKNHTCLLVKLDSQLGER
ncbi:MAG: ferritin [Synergistaceae bacterium]|nr:ferritin [Synergistaceae bacterium]